MQVITCLCLTVFVFATSTPAFAVLQTVNLEQSVTIHDMATSLLGGSDGVSITDVSYEGDGVAAGTFSDDSDAVGFASGILLTSGHTANVVPPNNTSSASADNRGGSSRLLSGLIGGARTYDAAILTIKFVPTGDRIGFNFTFGSEEFNDYVDTGFNDVFGLFVNGENRALTPDTGKPIAINNINCGNEGTDASGPNCSSFINSPTGTQLNGLTRVISLGAEVRPGVENILILGIADAGDSIFDSAVFISGGPIQSQPNSHEIPEGTSGLHLAAGLIIMIAGNRLRWRS